MTIMPNAAVSLRRGQKRFHSPNRLASILTSTIYHKTLRPHVIASTFPLPSLFRSISVSSTSSSVTPTFLAAVEYDHPFRHNRDIYFWRFAAAAGMGCLMMASPAKSLCDGDSVEVDPPVEGTNKAIKAEEESSVKERKPVSDVISGEDTNEDDEKADNKEKDEEIGDDNKGEDRNEEDGNEAPVEEEAIKQAVDQPIPLEQVLAAFEPSPLMVQQEHAALVKRIAKCALQMDRWLRDLVHDGSTWQQYQAHNGPPVVERNPNDNQVVIVDNNMTKPEILVHIARTLIQLHGWGKSPDLIPLVVQQLESARLQTHTKKDLVTFYYILRRDLEVFPQTGPCLHFFRAYYECLMMQPPGNPQVLDPYAVAAVDTTSVGIGAAAPADNSAGQTCPNHYNLVQNCIKVTKNIVGLISRENEYEKMQQELSEMIESAEHVPWKDLPYTLDLTPWLNYARVRGWTKGSAGLNDLMERLKEEEEWRKNTLHAREQPYWEQVQYDWTDVPVTTLHVDLPNVDPATGHYLVKAWARDSSTKTLVVLGLCDGKPPSKSRPRRRRPRPRRFLFWGGEEVKDVVTMPISIMVGRTNGFDVYALYAPAVDEPNNTSPKNDKKSKQQQQPQQPRLYHYRQPSITDPLMNIT